MEGEHQMIAYWRESLRTMPRPIRRLMWWWLLPFAGIALVIVLTTLPHFTPYKPLRPLGPFQGVGVFAFQFITMGITIFKTRAVRRAFNASGGRLCTECGHSLAGVGEVGRCPECGHGFHIECDRLLWKDAGIELNRRS